MSNETVNVAHAPIPPWKHVQALTEQGRDGASHDDDNIGADTHLIFHRPWLVLWRGPWKRLWRGQISA